jgi:hypothetical protein
VERCKVCGGFAWCRVIDHRGVESHYCEVHGNKMAPELMEAQRSAPPAMPSVSYLRTCQRCGRGASVSIAEAQSSRIEAQHFCPRCARLLLNWR